MLAEFELRVFLSLVILAVFTLYKRQLVDLSEGLFVITSLFALSLVPLPNSQASPAPVQCESPAPTPVPTPLSEPFEIEPPPAIDDLKSVTVRKTPELRTATGEESRLKPSPVESPRAVLQHATLESALEAAGDRPVLCYYTWKSGCPPCEKIKQHVLPNSDVQTAILEFESARLIVNQQKPWLADEKELSLFTKDADTGADRDKLGVPYCAIYDPLSGGTAGFMPGGYGDDPAGFIQELRAARERAAAKQSSWFVME